MRVTADATVTPLIGLLESISDIVLRKRGAFTVSATDLLLRCAGGQVVDSVAGGFLGNLSLSRLDAALLAVTLLVPFVFASLRLGGRDARAGRIGPASGCTGMLHHTTEVAKVIIVVCDHTVLARYACSHQLVSVHLLFEKLTASVLSTHDNGEFPQSGAIGNIAEYLFVVVLVTKFGRVLADRAVVVFAALLKGLADVIFRQGGTIGAFEIVEFGPLAELGKGRSMGQGHQSVEDDGFHVEEHFERLGLWAMAQKKRLVSRDRLLRCW